MAALPRKGRRKRLQFAARRGKNSFRFSCLHFFPFVRVWWCIMCPFRRERENFANNFASERARKKVEHFKVFFSNTWKNKHRKNSQSSRQCSCREIRYQRIRVCRRWPSPRAASGTISVCARPRGRTCPPGSTLWLGCKTNKSRERKYT